MLKTLKIAGAAIILATLATVSAQAKQVEKYSPRYERVQKAAAAPFVLIIGIGY